MAESLRKGNPTKKGQKHQNSYAFKHNKNSRKTREIAKINHHGALCKRCQEKIDWRKKFRKYKPIKDPGICNGCKQRNVMRAYHTLCSSCAGGRQVCAKCTKKFDAVPTAEELAADAAEGQDEPVVEAGGEDAAMEEEDDDEDDDDDDEEDDE